MAHRVGVCSSCGSRFQIPATFAHDRARCRTCGGVVEIGPPVGVEGAPPAPAAAPVSAPAPAPVTVPRPAVAAPPERRPEPVPVSTATSAATAATPVAAAKRGPNVLALLVGALVVAALAFGAWRYFR